MIAEVSTSAVPATHTQTRYAQSIACRYNAAMDPSKPAELLNMIAPHPSARRMGLAEKAWRNCRFLFHFLDALDRGLIFRTVFVPDRLHGILEGLLGGGGHLDDLDAGCLGLVHRLLLIGFPELALFLLGFLAELHQQRLIIHRHRVPDLFRHHQHFRYDQMLVEGVEFSDLIVVVEHEAGRIVLGAVDYACLQRTEYLIVTHGDAIAAHRVCHIDEDRIADDANLHALEVGDGLDRLFGVVETARAGIHPAQADEPLAAVSDLIEQVLADRAVDHVLHMRRVAEHVRHIEHVEIVDYRAERANADTRESDGADLGLLDCLLLAAELHGGIHRNRDAAIGGTGKFFAHILDRDDRWITGWMDIRGLKNQLLLCVRGARGANPYGDEQAGGD